MQVKNSGEEEGGRQMVRLKIQQLKQSVVAPEGHNPQVIGSGSYNVDTTHKDMGVVKT